MDYFFKVVWLESLILFEEIKRDDDVVVVGVQVKVIRKRVELVYLEAILVVGIFFPVVKDWSAEIPKVVPAD